MQTKNKKKPLIEKIFFFPTKALIRIADVNY